MMKAPYLLVTAALIASPAAAQTGTSPSTTTPAPAATMNTPMKTDGQWRASKLIGVDVHNQQNENIGEINELLLTPSGQVAGAVIGVGGFLGMGERNVMVTMDKLKFDANSSTTGASSSDNRWAPERAVINATKDQIKAMPEFKY